MTASTVDRDERTIAVENASYRWAYQLLSFGILVVVAYRSFVFGESAWDLFALVIASGLVPLFYQGSNQALPADWARRKLTTALVGLLAAAAVVAVLLLVR
jgi:hypothetical protein